MDEVTLMELIGKETLDPAERQLLESYKEPGMMNKISPQYWTPYQERVGLGEAPDRGLNSVEKFIKQVLCLSQ